MVFQHNCSTNSMLRQYNALGHVLLFYLFGLQVTLFSNSFICVFIQKYKSIIAALIMVKDKYIEQLQYYEKIDLCLSLDFLGGASAAQLLWTSRHWIREMEMMELFQFFG